MRNNTLWDYGFYAEFCENDRWKHFITQKHFHNVYEIYFLVENEVLYLFDEETHLVKSGMVLIIPPNMKHTTFPINEFPRKRYLIYLPEQFVKDVMENQGELLKKFPVKPFSVSPNESLVEELFKNLVDEYETDNKNVLIQKEKISKILSTLGRIFDETRQDERYFEEQDNASKPIDIIAKYINEHYYEKISLETLAEKFFMNSSYISRSFKQKFNVTFSIFLKNVRISKVIEFLLDTDYSIAEIATKTGFDSTTSLCRIFKKSIGISPLKCRNLYKKQTLNDKKSKE